MAKSLLRIEARRLRTSGKSIKDIAHQLKVSQGTASLWCRDIRLSPSQVKTLLASKQKNITRGRLRGAQTQRNKRQSRIRKAEAKAQKLYKLTRGEFFVAGLALYLGEGSKTTSVVEFTNGNHLLILFMLRWFKKFYNISKTDMRFSLLLNEAFQPVEQKIQKDWVKILGISIGQFTKTRFSKVKRKKIYQESNTYKGTINFRIRRSSQILYELQAYMNRMVRL